MNSDSTDERQIRLFGLVALVFFGCLSTLGLWLGRPLPMYLFGALCVIGLGFLLLPSPMRPVYHGWLKIAHFLGRTITTVMLTLIYYLVITPSALLLRLFKGHLLPLKPDRTSPSYWVPRTEPTQPRERFIKRY